jgi:type I restriction enzyme S subunit
MEQNVYIAPGRITHFVSIKSKVARLQENFNKISQECDALKQAILRKVFE